MKPAVKHVAVGTVNRLLSVAPEIPIHAGFSNRVLIECACGFRGSRVAFFQHQLIMMRTGVHGFAGSIDGFLFCACGWHTRKREALEGHVEFSNEGLKLA